MKGWFFTDKTGLKIFVFINAMIFAFTTFVTNPPLYGKMASKVWKIYFQYISPHFLDAAGSQISDLWLLLLSNSSLFSALMSHLPLLLLHSAVSYFAGLDAPVVDTVTYFGGNHRSRVWKSLKLKKVFFPRTRTSWDKYMFNRIVFLKI